MSLPDYDNEISYLKDIRDQTAGEGTGTTAASQLLPESSSYTIPAGSHYAVSFFTGTGTFNGAAVPAGFSRESVTAADLVVTTDAASTCYIEVDA